MLFHQILIAQRLAQPIPQQFDVVVERSENPTVKTKGYGRTPDDAAKSVRRNATSYGYYDATAVYPAPEDSAPDRGNGR
ncbi:hypothetical protein [Microcoleus sp. MON2_D5]|uniref:hypothetical protein n=1 Tax=Microcoleus sp. MON2_D5 TaxID=2818833 RepID=UPI002FCF8B4C